MDNLEILKKQWKSGNQDLPRLSYKEIYKMLLKKSSSIVKWIFIISIAELSFWLSLYFIIPDSNLEIMDKMGIGNFILYSNIIHFTIFGVFIYLFYTNFRSISVTDNTKNLMNRILKTRRIVKYFVYYNIGMFIISSVILDIFFYNRSEQLYNVMDFASQGVPLENFATIFIISQIIVGILVVGILMLFYWLVYGLLLRRLRSNYKELKKIDQE
jgi:hypothetical protein